MEALLTPLSLLYVVAGLTAGLTGGLLGLGGGIVLVPLLLPVYAHLGFPEMYLMQMAVATSLATIIFTSASAAWTHHRHGMVIWSVVGSLVPGLLIGSGLGALAVSVLPSEILRYLFGVFEALIAWRLWFGRDSPSAGRSLSALQMSFAGTGIGTLSVLVGIGGGTMIVPFLLYCRQGMRQAIGTSSACGAALALAGTVTLAVLHWGRDGLPDGNLGFVHWPAAVCIIAGSVIGARAGASLTNRLPAPLLRRLFAILLLIIGLRMLL